MFGAVVALCLMAHPIAAQSPTTRIVSTANAFLTTLDAQQKSAVQFAWNDEQQRARWSSFPVQMSRRAGPRLHDLGATQQSAAMQLVSTALSRRGFEKVQEIMEGDEVLKANERNNPLFGKDLYFISILGTPSVTAPWMLQFGGHHLALNVTVVGEQGVLTPSLTAAQPALYTVNGKSVRPLGQENDTAFALLAALDASQRSRAILNFRVADLVLGPSQDGKKIVPEGVKASTMNAPQRTMLLDLISAWTGIVHEAAAEARLAEIKVTLDDTWFAWSGATSVEPGHNRTSYPCCVNSASASSRSARWAKDF